MAHLELSIPWRGSTKQPRRPTYLNYPEGNFGGNQLLDGSISLSPLYPSQTNDLHVSIAAGLHQSFPLASPRSGIVHHLSGPDRYAHTQTLLRRSRSVGVAPLRGITPISFLAPYGFTRPLTRTHVRLLGSVFQDGSNGEPAGQHPGSTQMPKHAWEARAVRHNRGDGIPQAYRLPGLWPPASIRAGPRPESIGRPAHRRSTSDRDASPTPIRFPPDNFKHSLTLFSKFFSSFPRGTCSLSVSSPVFSLGRNLPPDWGCIPKQPDSPTAPRGAAGSEHNGALTLSGAPFQGTWARSAAEDASPDYNSNGEAARFSSWGFSRFARRY
ncbi:Uncharacterized protein Adt_49312 [Abeliophyllum distichum]|uniref:Protein TAR1 n=1 Tax=Abeliophyllum distichum TaxID=126358 RepID=A0ABD1NP53_9LAMI